MLMTLFIGCIVLMILGNVITIAEKLAQITHCPYSEYVFYCLIIGIIGYFIVYPIVKIYRSPELPPLSTDGLEKDEDWLRFANFLANNCGYLKNDERTKHQKTLRKDICRYKNYPEQIKSIVEKELKLRISGSEDMNILGIEKRIKEWAKTVFAITAISQNSKFDTLSVLVLNFKMIEDIIFASGYRPTSSQLVKLYKNILLTSLVTYCASELFDNIGDVEPLSFLDNANPQLDDVDVDGEEGISSFITKFLSELRIPAPFVSSALDGATNALMALRIGFVTKKYLTNGIQTSFSNRRKVKQEAMFCAIKTLPDVISESSVVIGKKNG